MCNLDSDGTARPDAQRKIEFVYVDLYHNPKKDFINLFKALPQKYKDIIKEDAKSNKGIQEHSIIDFNYEVVFAVQLKEYIFQITLRKKTIINDKTYKYRNLIWKDYYLSSSLETKGFSNWWQTSQLETKSLKKDLAVWRFKNDILINF